MSDKNVRYAAAEGREFLRGELEGKDPEYVRQFAGLVNDRQTLDLLNYYCSLWADAGEDFLDTHLAKTILRNAATRSIDDAYSMGNVSKLKGMVGLTTSEKDGREAISNCARRLADEGAIYLVLGPPGAGKTAYALDVARVWKALTGGTVLANIDWEGADEIVADSRTMLDTMAETKGPVLQIIDEAGQNLTSKGEEQQVTDQFVKRLKLIRKQEDGDKYPKRGSLLAIGHTRIDTAAEIRRLASGAFSKPHREDPGYVQLLDSQGGKDEWEESTEYRGVTDTAENYDEHDPTAFEVITEDTDEDGEDGPDPDDVRWDEHVKTVIKACKPWDDDSGMSYPDAAELVPKGDSWVGNRVREWKKGEHRDLVADPKEATA